MLNKPTDESRELLRTAMPILQIEMIDRGFWRSCLNCEHWTANDIVLAERAPTHMQGGCKLAEGTVPPPVVVVLGCDEWRREVPF